MRCEVSVALLVFTLAVGRETCVAGASCLNPTNAEVDDSLKLFQYAVQSAPRARSKEHAKLQNQFAGGACQIDQRGEKCNGAHVNSCRWPELKEFDLVISWTTRTQQSDIKASLTNLLEMASSTSIENESEIKYALRSFEEHGLLDHVGTVYLLMDQSVLETFGAPRFFDYKNKALRIVTERDLGVKYIGKSKIDQFLNLDRIPGISDYFLWVPDDNLMMKPFRMDYLYDPAQGKPLLYSFGTYSLGWCDNLQAVGSTHGPVLFNKCAYSTAAENYWRMRKGGGANQSIDVLCLYTNALKSHWVWKGFALDFHRECHTNGGCSAFRPDEKPLFFDVQGNDISDEYSSLRVGPMPEKWLMPDGPTTWYHEQCPKPSRFEQST